MNSTYLVPSQKMDQLGGKYHFLLFVAFVAVGNAGSRKSLTTLEVPPIQRKGSSCYVSAAVWPHSYPRTSENSSLRHNVPSECFLSHI